MSSKPRTLAAALRSLDNEAASDSTATKRDFCQYNVLDNGKYSAAHTTIATLPAGSYHLDWEPNTGIIFKKLEIKGDKFLNLEESLSGDLFKEIAEFWKRGDTFKKFGLLHRRGYLLYGPQGSGKSSIIAQTTHELASRENGVAFVCSTPSLMSDGLATFRKVEPLRPVICVFEDIDEIIEERGERDLLALLDGETQIDRVINVATTNYPEKLEGRIIARPRRFDRIIKVDMPSDKLRKSYFKEKLNLEAKDLEKWTTDTEGLSFACLTELVISVKCLDHDYEETLKILKDISKIKSSSSEFDKTEKPGFAFK